MRQVYSHGRLRGPAPPGRFARETTPVLECAGDTAMTWATMIIDETQRSRCSRFVIRPNSSLSWHGNKVFFLIMCVISFGIASVFAAAGYWVVFPFAGLEMGVLGVALYLCASQAAWCEVVSIDEDQVQVLKGRDRPEQTFVFNRHWARVVLSRPVATGHPGRLSIRSHGQEVEVGAFLNREERERLASALQRAIVV